MTSDERQNLASILAYMTASGSVDQEFAPQDLLVAACLLSGVISVDSIIIGKDGHFDIVLRGFIKGNTNSQNLL